MLNIIMTIKEIEKYLSSYNTILDKCILININLLLTNAKKNQNEEQANNIWCLKQIYQIQNHFTKAFSKMKNNEFKDAWRLLDQADIEICFLEKNFEYISNDNDCYHIEFIKNIIPEYKKTYPYLHFASRESIIKSEKCSICGKVLSLRSTCGHKAGKLYMGELCGRIVTDLEIKRVCIVKDPYDKYAIIEIEGKEYNYDSVKKTVSKLSVPYESFHVNTIIGKPPKYANLKNNNWCPCGSGKKYKHCHLGTQGELIKKQLIIYDKAISTEESEEIFHDTWK